MASAKKSSKKTMVQTLVENQGINFREWEEEQLNQAKVDLMMNPRNSVWNDILREGIYSKFLKNYLEKQIRQATKKKNGTQENSSFSTHETDQTTKEN